MGIRIDGKKIASMMQHSLKQEFKALATEPVFSIIYVGQDPVIDNFIAYKKAFGKKVGVQVVVHNFDEGVTVDELECAMHDIEKTSDAIIVQLPLPQHLEAQRVLDMVPVEKDVDVLSTTAKLMFKQKQHDMYPPVTGAMVQVLESQLYDLQDKNIVLVGYGNLVGKPFADMLEGQGIPCAIVDRDTDDQTKKDLLWNADLVVAGAGVPGLITGDLLSPQTALLDGGTSEAGKRVVGDVDPSCYDDSLFYTPVPGGIGPITIAVLYQNILKTQKMNKLDL